MNFRKDVQSLTEAYKQIAEAPTDPGPSFGDETSPPEDVKYLDKKGALSDEDRQDVLNKIVKEVKDMLESYEESHFPGSFKDFRDNPRKPKDTLVLTEDMEVNWKDFVKEENNGHK